MSQYDPEPQPGDGPQYHDDHAAWRSRQPRGPSRIIKTTPYRLRMAIGLAHADLRAQQPLIGPGRTVSVDDWCELIVKHLGDDVNG